MSKTRDHYEEQLRLARKGRLFVGTSGALAGAAFRTPQQAADHLMWYERRAAERQAYREIDEAAKRAEQLAIFDNF